LEWHKVRNVVCFSNPINLTDLATAHQLNVEIPSIVAYEQSVLVQRGGKTSTRRFLTEVNRYAYVLRLVTKDGKKIAFLLEDEEHVMFWKNVLETPLTSSKVDMGRVVSSLNRSLEQISTRRTETDSPPVPSNSGTDSPSSLVDSGSLSSSSSSSSLSSLESSLSSSGNIPSRERMITASTIKKHYLYSEHIIQHASFEHSQYSDLINLTRRLCERGKQEAGLTLCTVNS
jgi:hypothetical protein